MLPAAAQCVPDVHAVQLPPEKEYPASHAVHAPVDELHVVQPVAKVQLAHGLVEPVLNCPTPQDVHEPPAAKP